MLWSGFLLGFLGSLHCLGMCGPIALMLPISRSNTGLAFVQIMQYHLGRIFTYALFGILFGFFGKGLALAGLQQNLSIWLGILFLSYLLFTYLLKFKTPTWHAYNKVLMFLQARMSQFFKSKKPGATFVMGVLNGFLPCGMVYMALFGSMAMASLELGMMYMMLFGLGTVPLMSLAAYMGRKPGFLKIRWQRVLPVMIFVFGVYFLLRGLGLGIPYVSPAVQHLQVKAEAACVVPVH
ncbi:MAG: sulfite exporter TauE/SafE family protein [Flavobacteriaceae bacterium]|nr:sulfite exporter TauE/SafE family protein [Flavobacteriaceae bacterium]